MRVNSSAMNKKDSIVYRPLNIVRACAYYVRCSLLILVLRFPEFRNDPTSTSPCLFHKKKSMSSVLGLFLLVFYDRIDGPCIFCLFFFWSLYLNVGDFLFLLVTSCFLLFYVSCVYFFLSLTLHLLLLFESSHVSRGRWVTWV